jgi:hypothetical protein
VKYRFEPQFITLMDNNEQQFIMFRVIRQWSLQ